MSLRAKLTEEMKVAMKSGDRARLSTLRLLISAAKNREIDIKRELNDEEVCQVISTMVRQRRESIEQFKAGGRQDLVDKEENELATLTEFLPPQLSRDDIASLVSGVVEEINAAGMKDMGRVMKELLPKVTGKADGKVVSDIVKEQLTART
ncbi:MAG: GatB/YqeY domain-containing protein [Deltaproteobacteria bacterium]|nr:GatB/YqeY domain-containing protein [Deltaproteobacteria bacterium]